MTGKCSVFYLLSNLERSYKNRSKKNKIETKTEGGM